MNLKYDFDLKKQFPDHFPVMLKEVIEIFSNHSSSEDSIFLDCTLGAGGHSSYLFEIFKSHCRFLASERDRRMIEIAKKNFTEKNISFFDLNHEFSEDLIIKESELKKNRIHILYKRFSQVASILEQSKLKVNYLLCDLGVSMSHFTNQWGFSYMDTRLDMKLDPLSKDVYEILNTYEEKEIAKILDELGEERLAYPIAKEIIKSRPIENTNQLKKCILNVYRRKIKKYTDERVVQRSFQALRIYVNDELKELETILNHLPNILKGIGIFISFHSLEDRIVKQKLKELSKKGFQLLTKKPLQPTEEELKINYASHSAKMRVILCEKIL